VVTTTGGSRHPRVEGTTGSCQGERKPDPRVGVHWRDSDVRCREMIIRKL
jgi:hypothetical protein